MGAPLVHARLVESTDVSAEYALTVVDPDPVEVGRETVRLDDHDVPYSVAGGPDAQAAALLVAGRILRDQRNAGRWPPGVTRAG
jgi:hypothetical protein